MNIYTNKKDEALTADWLRDIGLDVPYFNTTHIKLLKAQKTAQTLLDENINLLTDSQITILKNFLTRIQNKKTRLKLKPDNAYPIFNINTKINRQLFKQYKKL